MISFESSKIVLGSVGAKWLARLGEQEVRSRVSATSGGGRSRDKRLGRDRPGGSALADHAE
jgi:hypothetical protein